jgi:hypothetical protein
LGTLGACSRATPRQRRLQLSGAKQVQELFELWGLADWTIIIGLGELASTVLFLIPRTAVVGTLLLSAYLGGAIVTHMQRAESFATLPWYSWWPGSLPV